MTGLETLCPVEPVIISVEMKQLFSSYTTSFSEFEIHRDLFEPCLANKNMGK